MKIEINEIEAEYLIAALLFCEKEFILGTSAKPYEELRKSLEIQLKDQWK